MLLDSLLYTIIDEINIAYHCVFRDIITPKNYIVGCDVWNGQYCESSVSRNFVQKGLRIMHIVSMLCSRSIVAWKIVLTIQSQKPLFKSLQNKIRYQSRP